MIAATVSVGKVAAAAAASNPHSLLLPSVALTPMAQSFGQKKAQSSAVDHSSLPSASHNQHLNDVNFNIAGGVSSVKILSKSSSPLELSGPSGHPSISMAVGNGANHEGSAVGSNTTNSLLLCPSVFKFSIFSLVLVPMQRCKHFAKVIWERGANPDPTISSKCANNIGQQ